MRIILTKRKMEPVCIQAVFQAVKHRYVYTVMLGHYAIPNSVYRNLVLGLELGLGFSFLYVLFDYTVVSRLLPLLLMLF